MMSILKQNIGAIPALITILLTVTFHSILSSDVSIFPKIMLFFFGGALFLLTIVSELVRIKQEQEISREKFRNDRC